MRSQARVVILACRSSGFLACERPFLSPVCSARSKKQRVPTAVGDHEEIASPLSQSQVARSARCCHCPCLRLTRDIIESSKRPCKDVRMDYLDSVPVISTMLNSYTALAALRRPFLRTRKRRRLRSGRRNDSSTTAGAEKEWKVKAQDSRDAVKR